MNKRVLMVATVPSMIGQFNINNIHLLLEMGYTNSWQLTPATYKVFYKKLNKKLHEEFNCTYGYTQLKIIYNQEHIVQAIPMEAELLNKRLLHEATKAGILKTTMNEFDKLQSKEVDYATSFFV